MNADGDVVFAEGTERPLQMKRALNVAPDLVHYAGDGKFSYELDILNMAEVMEVIGASGWTPPPTFNPPPRHPVRDTTPTDGMPTA